MPPARAARPAAAPARRGVDDSGGSVPVLVARLEAAADAGDVDARQLADHLGVAAGALRALLAEPARLTVEQAAAVAHALAVDAATMRALRRAALPAGPDASPIAPAHQSTAAAPAAAAPAAGSHSPAPRSTLDLLGAIVDAVRPDAAGHALRTAVLDVAAEAARAVGRPLPPGAHALRARLAADAPGVDDGRSGPPADASASNVLVAPVVAADVVLEADVVASEAAALVRELQRTAPGYDDLFAPLHDDALADLLARHALAVHAAPGVPAGTRFVLTPPLFGRRRLVLAAAATADQRRLALRSALAACAAGHAADDRPLASPAPCAVALATDVAALADLVPFWQVADLRRRGRLGWRALAVHVAEAAAAMARDWPPAHAADVGTARVALFRHHGL
jgi:hypothetical protein